MVTAAANNDLPAPTFDLESWSSNYDGALLPIRLAHVASRCPPLRHQSLTLALAKAKDGKDIHIYRQLCGLARSLGLSELSTPDADWLAHTEQANQRELSRLESELRGYKNNLIRESIRMGQEDLASHLLATGGPPPDPTNTSTTAVGYNAAYQALGKMRDYCTTPSQLAAMSLRLIYTALLLAVTSQQQSLPASSHLNNVHAHTSRVRVLGCKEEEQNKLNAISSVTSGIAMMAAGNYAEATKSFLQSSFDYHHVGAVHGLDFERLVASANDVAVYGGLCALATLSREELEKDVLGGTFRPFLEQEPHMRKAIGLYITAKYQPCLALLQHYRADWALDVFLSPQVDRLLALIRQRSITAYLSSFSQVSFAALASTFPPPPHTRSSASSASAEKDMEQELLDMIRRGILVDARLDVVDGMLLAPQADPRHAAHEQAVRTAANIERTLALRLHRVNVSLAGLEVVGREAGRIGM